MTSIKELVDLIGKGDADKLRQLLNEDHSLAEQKTEQGISLLQLAIYYRNTSIIDILKPYYKNLSLFEAASLGALDVVQRAIKTNPELTNAFAADGFTALGLACFFGQYEVAEFLLRNNADPNIASNNPFKVAPIHSACAISNLELTELLIKFGANVNARQQQGVTPLHETAHHGKTALTKLLLMHGADATAKTDSGQTPLDMALEKGFTETVELLKV